jgi:hypothetical protein
MACQWRELNSSPTHPELTTLQFHPVHKLSSGTEITKTTPQMFKWALSKPGVFQMWVTRASSSPHRGDWTHFTALNTALHYNMTYGRVKPATETLKTLTSFSNEVRAATWIFFKSPFRNENIYRAKGFCETQRVKLQQICMLRPCGKSSLFTVP